MKQTSLLIAGMIATSPAAASEVPSSPAIQPDDASIQVQDTEQLPNLVMPIQIVPPESSDRIASEHEPVESKLQIKHKHLLKRIRSQLKSKSIASPEHSSSSNSISNQIQAASAVPVKSLNSDNEMTDQINQNQVSQSNVREPAPVAPEFLPIDGFETETAANTGMEQVTSVSQLDDVKPDDWAFTALQILVERYGCIAGYPDGTFRGNRTMTRYEFAAGVNACWERINELIAQNTENAVTQADLVTLQRLKSEWEAEIEAVQARVDNLEVQNAQLQANQFSATTKLIGQGIISVQGTNAPDVSLFPGDQRQAQTNVTMTSSAQLTLATSFTGRDLLLTGLAGGNLGSNAPQVFSNMGRLGFESDTGDNDIYVNELSYRFPLADNFGVVVGTSGVNPTNTFRGINPLEGSGDGAISLFGQRNPILAVGGGRSGIGFDWQMSDRISLQGIYTTEVANLPGDSENAGLIGGRYTLGTQVTLAPTDNLDVGIHYLFNHSPDDNLRTGIGDTQLTSPFAPRNAFDTHAVGATVAWRVNENLQLGSWGGWTFSSPVELSGSVETMNWAVFAALPNLFRPGNLGGVIFGQPPKITSSTLPDGYNLPNFAVPDFDNGGGAGGRDDTSLHLEMFYRAQINNNLSLTPGVFVIFNPNHNQGNDALIVGTLRATFRF